MPNSHCVVLNEAPARAFSPYSPGADKASSIAQHHTFRVCNYFQDDKEV